MKMSVTITISFISITLNTAKYNTPLMSSAGQHPSYLNAFSCYIYTGKTTTSRMEKEVGYYTKRHTGFDY